MNERALSAQHRHDGPRMFGGKMARIGESLLKVAGLLNFLIALFHIGVIFIGAPAYRYFGAGEQMASWAEAGSPIPAIITFCLAVLFAGFGLYAFSGAKAFRKLPFLVPALIFIGVIYTVRGLIISPSAIFGLSTDPALLAPKKIVFSLGALGIGLLYLSGTVMLWNRLRS
jgi:hypothetical protein